MIDFRSTNFPVARSYKYLQYGSDYLLCNIQQGNIITETVVISNVPFSRLKAKEVLYTACLTSYLLTSNTTCLHTLPQRKYIFIWKLFKCYVVKLSLIISLWFIRRRDLFSLIIIILFFLGSTLSLSLYYKLLRSWRLSSLAYSQSES